MYVLGLDIGKSELHVRLLRVHADGATEGVGRPRMFANDASGHAALLGWLAQHYVSPQETHAVMEATGVYWERVAIALHEQQYAMGVVNAAQIKFFARSTLRRGKTDTMDAELIARYGATMRPSRWQSAERDLDALRDLLRERDLIVELITLEKSRLHAYAHSHLPNPVVVDWGQARLALLEQQRDLVNAAMAELITRAPMLHARVDLLCSVPGIGRLSAAILLSETTTLTKMTDARQWAAYAGLSPVPKQSGAMVGKTRISKIGNARLRRAMYLCAVSASRMSTPQGDFYRRLVAAGKPKKVALIALARKLLRICFAVLRDRTPYTRAFVRH